ncbi:centrosomal protein of 97 kDa [Plutella xylostella]|uniref:centrosomal protein of 97 kDa n=1 Tax=Plutella xylostella TaxID=51655 RepID=UPI0020323B10|nr:centrosomal protein of 97 kDa [Plutella xylostella]
MDEEKTETLDLSRRGLKKIEKATAEESTTVINLILDQNELQRLDNLDTYSRVENLSICNNFLLRMHGVSRMTNIRVLALNNNGILQIEGLKDLIYLKVLKLAGNNIKSIEHLNNNMHIEHLDLSNNQISFVADISYMKSLKNLNLERNRIADLRQCDRYLPPALAQLGLAHNNIQDLNEVSHLVHLTQLEGLTVQGNPCVSMSGKDKVGFDYRPFVLNWIMSVKSIDGFGVSAIESLKAEWLYSQGKGRHFRAGQQRELGAYLAATCPLTAESLDTEDQRKLRLILSKAQHHQQQLKEHTPSPVKSKLQSPRMQSRITPRHMGRSPDRMSSSYHSPVTSSDARPVTSDRVTSDLHRVTSASAMTQSCDAAAFADTAFSEKRDREAHTTPQQQQQQIPTHQPNKPVNQNLEAASKMVPVPESLMSPDYQDPIYDIQKPRVLPGGMVSNTSSSNSSIVEEKRQIVQPNSINKNHKSSPKLSKSATSSPKLRSKLEQRKNSLTPRENGKVNGVADRVEEKEKGTQRRTVKAEETSAAITIQRMWRGYRSRSLNKDTLRILHAIQACRARQHIQRLTCDMEATKAALDSERKIQQLQMQAINALWKKVSTIQDSQKKSSECDDNTEVLKQLTETCFNLQSQVVELQGCMQQVLRAVSRSSATPVATQTDICAVITPQEDRCTWLKRPQSLPLATSTVPAPPPLHDMQHKTEPLDLDTADVERTESNIEEIQTDQSEQEKLEPTEQNTISEHKDTNVTTD